MFIFLAAIVGLVFVAGSLCVVNIDSHNHNPSSWKRVRVTNSGQMVGRCSCGKTIKKYDDGWA